MFCFSQSSYFVKRIPVGLRKVVQFLFFVAFLVLIYFLEIQFFFNGFQYPFSNPCFFHCFLSFLESFLIGAWFCRRVLNVSKNLLNENSTSFLLNSGTDFQFILHNSDLNWASLKFLKSWLYIFVFCFLCFFVQFSYFS